MNRRATYLPPRSWSLSAEADAVGRRLARRRHARQRGSQVGAWLVVAAAAIVLAYGATLAMLVLYDAIRP